jgi:hypothetical protein
MELLTKIKRVNVRVGLEQIGFWILETISANVNFMST